MAHPLFVTYAKATEDRDLQKRVREVIRKVGSMNKAAQLFGVHRISLLAFQAGSVMHSETIERIRQNVKAAESAASKEKEKSR